MLDFWYYEFGGVHEYYCEEMLRLWRDVPSKSYWRGVTFVVRENFLICDTQMYNNLI